MLWFKKKTKEQKILDLLKRKKNKPVSAWDIAMCAKTLDHRNLVQRLRRNHKIPQHFEYVDWKKLSFYTLKV